MSQTVEDYTEFFMDEDGEFLADGTPHVVIFDNSSLADDLAQELDQIPWEHQSVDDEQAALDEITYGEGDCIIFDPHMLPDPLEFLLDLRRKSDIPVIVWGNDLGGDALRQIAGISDTHYVPKSTGEQGKVFCMSSLNESPQTTPTGPNSSSSSLECDEILVSIIYHSVRAYWREERIQTQLDAIENSLNGIAILDDEHDFLYANETLVNQLGYDTAETLNGNGAQMCFPHHEIERFKDDILSEARTEGDWRGVIDCRRMNGSVFPARLSVSALSDGQFILTLEDISEEQLLQDELEEIHQHIGQAFIAVEEDLRISHLNETARAYFDLPERDDLVGEKLFDVHFAEIEEELRDGLSEVDVGNEATSFSVHTDSLGSWLEVRIYSFDRGYALYFRDITEEKENQRQMDLAKTFIEESSDAYFVIEVESAEIVDINSTAHKWLGVGKEDLVGMSVVDLINRYSDVEDYTLKEHYDFCEEARGDGVAIHEAKYGPPAGTMYPVKARGTCKTVNGTEYLIVVGRDAGRKAYDPEQGGVGVTESFLEGCPDPAVVVDPKDNEVLKANLHAVEALGMSRDELIGSHYRQLFPEEIADDQMEAFKDLLANGGGRYRRLDDGSYVTLRSESGETPVEISGTTIEMADQTGHLNVIRPIQDAVDYERSFQQVNDMTHEMVRQDSTNEIARTAADSIAEMPMFLGSAVYLYDDSVPVLEATAVNEPTDGIIKDIRSFEPGDGELWDVYSDNTTRIFHEDEQIVSCETPHGEVAVPIGSHGVLFVCSPGDIATENDVVVNFATVVASSIESAFDRANSITELKEREREANIQRQQLEYVSDLNDQIRSLNKALVQAESKDAIRTAVCSQLSGLDDFHGILFSDTNASGDGIEPLESEGIPDEFRDQLPLDDSPENLPPTVKAAVNQEIVEVSNIASKAQEEDWANTALEHEYKSAISIHLEYGDISYGVLTIYSNLTEAFDGRTKDVLEELGSLIAYAFHAVTSRAALGSDTGMDLSLTIDGTGGLSTLAETLDETLTVQNVTPANDDEYYLVHSHIQNADYDTVVDVADEISAVDDCRVIGEPESGIYELKLDEPGSLIQIVDLGVSLESAAVSPKDTNVIVTLPANRDRGEFIDQVKNQVPATAELHASQEDLETDTIPWTRMLRGALTEKQEQALRTAYYAHYFDSPSKTDGRELADQLGVSQATISYRIRAAQRNLFETMWNADTGSQA